MKSQLSPLKENEPVRVRSHEDVNWADTADVVVVGFGAAGASAALAVRETGADVIVVDRFGGGGATALSGGVFYAGATRFQQEAGYADTSENMFNYLREEVGEVVKPATLRRFCETSNDNLEWLIGHGAKFSGNLRSMNAEYMEQGHSLYFSGNERTKRMSAVAKPAPRGHIFLGDGTGSMGRYLFGALRAAVSRMGARVYLHSPVTRLVTDDSGAIIGVEVNELPRESAAGRRHRRLVAWFNKGQGVLYGLPARMILKRLNALEQSGVRKFIRARRAVVLATGGFIHNRGMVETYLPQHVNGITMGAAGDSGAGLFLGQSVGAAIDHLDNVFTSRALQFKPYLKGMLVDGDGRRFISEDAYGATIGRLVVERGTKAWLILDRELYRGIWKLIMPWRPMVMRYRARAFLSVAFGTRRARSLKEIARKCGVPLSNLEASLREFNAIAAGGADDPYGKLPANLHVLKGGPYYAIDCSTGSRGWPPLTFTLGGLRVDEDTGQVLRDDGSCIAGLYAAGRTAVGVSSNFYISGLSIADCVYSGRRTVAAITDSAVSKSL
jgi:3-oxo-5alpha-steroid 4-dehydrogenase